MTERIVALLEQVWKETPHATDCDVRRLVLRPCTCDWAVRVREKIARATSAAIREAIAHTAMRFTLKKGTPERDVPADELALNAFEGALLGGGER